jgi:hypothetical protein
VAGLAAGVASTIDGDDCRHATQAPRAAATPRARPATSPEVRRPGRLTWLPACMAATDPTLIVGHSAFASRTPSAPLRGRLRRSLTRPLRYPELAAMGSVAEEWPTGAGGPSITKSLRNPDKMPHIALNSL